MTTKELILFAMSMSEQLTMSAIESMRDNPVTAPTPNGGNHPLWVLGHLAHAEGMIYQTCTGNPNPITHWELLFGRGTTPDPDASAYPSFDAVLEKFRELRAANRAFLESLDESDMANPTVSPPRGMEEFFATIGQTYLLTALHMMNHRGQVADARRAAGLPGLVI